jgi:hypothetical protein
MAVHSRAELRGVGLTDHDRAGLSQPLDGAASLFHRALGQQDNDCVQWVML